jgi:predicted RNase H-like nuclease (RuvC/YqgF family)
MSKKYKELKQSMKDNEAQQRQVEQAFKDGKITLVEYNRSMANLKDEHERLQQQTANTTMSTEELKNTVDKLNNTKISASSNVAELEKERRKALEAADAYIKLASARILGLQQQSKQAQLENDREIKNVSEGSQSLI